METAELPKKIRRYEVVAAIAAARKASKLPSCEAKVVKRAPAPPEDSNTGAPSGNDNKIPAWLEKIKRKLKNPRDESDPGAGNDAPSP